MVVCGLSVLLRRLVLVLTFSVVFGTTEVVSNVAITGDVSAVSIV